MFGVVFLALGFWRWAFGVGRLALGIVCFTLGFLRLVFCRWSFGVGLWRWSFGVCLLALRFVFANGLFPLGFSVGFQRLAFVVGLLAGVSAHVQPRFARSC